jgi:multiple sugar transport system ATP-binding protein
MTKIKLKGLQKSFGALNIFRDLDLTIEDQSYVCLIGPSGCGKSTLMRIIAGLEEADGGQILFDGEDVSALGCADRDVGMAFQNYALYPHLDVAGNLKFPLLAPRHRGLYSKKEIADRVDSVAELLEISHLLHRTIGQLSGGQQQRVSLGRSLIRRPKVLLLDEPVTHLDARLRYAMRSELRRIHEVMGTTTIHVTHDQQEALAMSDHLVLLRDGGIEQQGPPMEIYTEPQTSFTAGFLGDPPRSIGTVPLRRVCHGFELVLGTTPLALPAQLGDACEGLTDENVTIALPASAINLASAGGAPIAGTVTAHEMIEGAQRIVLDVGGVRFTAQSAQVRHVAIGDSLSASVDISRAQLFSAKTGRRLTTKVKETL